MDLRSVRCKTVNSPVKEDKGLNSECSLLNAAGEKGMCMSF